MRRVDVDGALRKPYGGDQLGRLDNDLFGTLIVVFSRKMSAELTSLTAVSAARRNNVFPR